jgi:hypothetical protein
MNKSSTFTGLNSKPPITIGSHSEHHRLHLNFIAVEVMSTYISRSS